MKKGHRQRNETVDPASGLVVPKHEFFGMAAPETRQAPQVYLGEKGESRKGAKKDEEDFRVHRYEGKAKAVAARKARQQNAKLLEATFSTRKIIAELTEVHSTEALAKGKFFLKQNGLASTTVHYWKGRFPKTVTIKVTHTHGVRPEDGTNRKQRRALEYADRVNPLVKQLAPIAPQGTWIDDDEDYLDFLKNFNPFAEDEIGRMRGGCDDSDSDCEEPMDLDWEDIHVEQTAILLGNLTMDCEQPMELDGHYDVMCKIEAITSGMSQLSLIALSGDIEMNPGPGKGKGKGQPSKTWNACGLCKSVWANNRCSNAACKKSKPPGGKGKGGKGGNPQMIPKPPPPPPAPKAQTRAKKRNFQISASIQESIEKLQGFQDAQEEKKIEAQEAVADAEPDKPDHSIVDLEPSNLPKQFSHTDYPQVGSIFGVRHERLTRKKTQLQLGAMCAVNVAIMLYVPKEAKSDAMLLNMVVTMTAVYFLVKLMFWYFDGYFRVTYKRRSIDYQANVGEVRMEKHHHTDAIYAKPVTAEYNVYDELCMDVFGRQIRLSSKRQHVMTVSLELWTQLAPTVVLDADPIATFLRLNRDIQRQASINIRRDLASSVGLVSETASFIMAHSLHLRGVRETELPLN